MMGNEEYGERRQTNHTPAIALGVAAVLLLIVGAMSYSDYLEDRFEEEYQEKERQLLARHGYPAGVAPGLQQPGVAATAGTPQVPAQPGVVQPGGVQPGVAQPGAVPQPATNPDLLRNAAEMGVESALPAPNDPEITSIQNSLDQVREQSRRNDQLYRDITSNVDTLAEDAATAAGVGDLSKELPDFLRDAVQDPPGGNPDIEARLARMREQVMKAPSLAKVTSFNGEWGLVTFDAGAAQNVKVQQRFAVRRGADVLGWIRVEEVQENQSIATLLTDRDNETSRKPEVGDDLIDFELF